MEVSKSIAVLYLDLGEYKMEGCLIRDIRARWTFGGRLPDTRFPSGEYFTEVCKLEEACQNLKPLLHTASLSAYGLSDLHNNARQYAK